MNLRKNTIANSTRFRKNANHGRDGKSMYSSTELGVQYWEYGECKKCSASKMPMILDNSKKNSTSCFLGNGIAGTFER